ncbi:MAG: hypothetical protein E7329_11655 [Clostridiales bacterium]|nr:hypothetical protein [Clostridiales bacterium]
MKKFWMTLLVAALAASGILNASLAAKNEGLQLQLAERTQELARVEIKWADDRQKAEEEKLELIRQVRLAQLENEALSMENFNLQARLSPQTEETLSAGICAPLTVEKIKVE